MRRSNRACPKCGAVLRYEEIMPNGPRFPCPFCDTELQVPDYYISLAWIGAIATPALILWAFGLSWLYIILAEFMVLYPVFYLTFRYVKYVIPPKIEIYLPNETELHLRDRRP